MSNCARDQHGPFEHLRIAIEVPMPSLVAQHDHRVARFIVGRRQRAAHHGCDPDDLEEIARHQRSVHDPAIDADVDVADSGVGVSEDARLSAQRFELRTCELRLLATRQLLPSTPYISPTAGTASTRNSHVFRT